jgi:hypothetical protein
VRLILPSGEYVVDGLWDFRRMPLTEVMDFHAATDAKVTYQSARLAIAGLLDAVQATGDTVGDDLGVALTQYPELVASLSWLAWIVRHHAGERQPSGAPLTLAEVAGAINVADVRFVADPGDSRRGKPVEEKAPDPRRPRRNGSSGRGASKKAGHR